MCREHGEQVDAPAADTSTHSTSAAEPTVSGSGHFVGALVGNAMISMVRFYQRGISPLLGKNCRYEPTCSQYFVLAVQKYGPLRGAWKGFWRIMRCHPFRPGGFDPP